jgi:excisionase family DNA binding protein
VFDRAYTEREVSIHFTALGDDGPLVVSPKEAARLLDIGVTKTYELIVAGELEAYKDGSARKITMRSICARIERKLSQAQAA